MTESHRAVRVGSAVLCVAILFSTGCAAHRAAIASLAQAPVVTVDSARESLPNDYLRVSFLSPGVNPATLSRPGALRAFATATPLYEPPLRVADLPYYSGLANDDAKVLVAMRCRPPRPEKVDAVLATWPNVFAAILRDAPVSGDACAGHPADAGTQVACYARDYSDSAGTAAPTVLEQTFAYAGRLFDPDHKALAAWLQTNYGIYPAFAGTGYSVKDTYTLDQQPMTAAQMLAKSVSSEYVLKNVSLADAGCRCIAVAPYPGRASDRLDPAFIEKAGGDGACRAVSRLESASR